MNKEIKLITSIAYDTRVINRRAMTSAINTASDGRGSGFDTSTFFIDP